MIGWRVFAVIGVLLVAAAVVQTVRLSAAEVLVAHKDTEISNLKRQATADRLKDEQRYRELEQAKASEAERVADEADKKLAAAAVRARSAERVARGLRHDIAVLNARPTPADPRVAAFAREAATARELLGESADAYRELAKTADGLGVQVAGLQDFAINTCGAGQSRPMK